MAGPGPTITLSSKHAPRPSYVARVWRSLPDCGVTEALGRCLRHPLVPTRPHTVVFALVLFASFVYTVTTFMIHILNTDKEPLPWRTYCQEQPPFPHEFADSLDPVNVFVGVFSLDAAYERRHLIRSTYARHSRPVDPLTGRPANNVQVKFILGRPKKQHARRIALEMEAYNDVVVLDIKENMNRGKTHAFFQWASENATVPVNYRSVTPAETVPGSAADAYGAVQADAVTMAGKPGEVVKIGVGFKKADYVVKADDDSFLVLSELERHLRVSPRRKTYWGCKRFCLDSRRRMMIDILFCRSHPPALHGR